MKVEATIQELEELLSEKLGFDVELEVVEDYDEEDDFDFEDLKDERD